MLRVSATALILLFRPRFYCPSSDTALPLLLCYRCYYATAATALTLLLRSRCYCALAATALPLLLRSRCYCAPAATALPQKMAIRRSTYTDLLKTETNFNQTNASRFRGTDFLFKLWFDDVKKCRGLRGEGADRHTHKCLFINLHRITTWRFISWKMARLSWFHWARITISRSSSIL